MSITPERKAELIKEYAIKDGDTGSPGSAGCNPDGAYSTSITEHFKEHKKDNHSRRGLLRMVATRRSFLRLYQEEKR